LAQRLRVDAGEPGGYVQFWSTGQAVKGEFKCSECAYCVTVFRELPQCPMCSGTSWEQVPWSPLTRALEAGGGSRDLASL
jgi:rubredoxin